MRQVPDALLTRLAGRFGYDAQALEILGGGREDSDGIVYRTLHSGKPYVFKIVGGNTANPGLGIETEARAAFFAFLGSKGLGVVAPEPNAQGNLIETVAEGNEAFLAYTYPFVTGEHPSPDHWTEDMIRAWGRTLGIAHRLTKAYPIWEGVPLSVDGPKLLTWRREIEGFRAWCQDEEIKAYWDTLQHALDGSVQTRDTVGFIHNDPHMQNILFDDGQVKLLDFDVSTCHFFACDLAIAIQSVLFTKGGGMDRPVEDQNAIDWFTGALLDGYAEENALTDDILGKLELFIGYRRALLYTVMQGWLDTKPDIKAAWKWLTLAAPRILRLG